MNETKFKQALSEWADDTADFYHDIATKYYDSMFYTQSDLTKVVENPDLLILAINPGSGYTYKSDQIDSPEWKKWGIGDRMDGKTLLKGNPTFYKRGTWRTWQGLTRIFKKGGITDILDDESRFVWTNIIFFNEPKERDIPAEWYKKCPAKTLELIKILKPKRILCLSINRCFSVLNQMITNREVLISSFLERGKLFDIPIYGIRHTAYGNAGEEVVGKSLKYLFEQESHKAVSKEEYLSLFADDIQQMGTKTQNLSEEIAEEVVKLCKEGWKTDHFEFLLRSNENGFIGVRYVDQKNRKADDDMMSKIKEILEKYEFSAPLIDPKNRVVWFGKKYFKAFGDEPKEIFDKILSELDKIKPQLESLYSAH